MSEDNYDVIIMGGGPAGLTAGLYTARHGLKTLLIEAKQLGGKAWMAHWIDNFPGFPEGISGADLMKRFIAQAEKFGVEFKSDTIVGLMDMGESKMVATRLGYHQAKAVIITVGVNRASLNIKGEKEFRGRGVCYCATCDGPFFIDKPVAVLGCGKDAVEDALRLAETSSKVYAIPGEKGFNDGIEELHKLKKNEKIKIIDNTSVKSILGEGVVTHLMLSKPPEKLPVDGVFIIPDSVGTSGILSDVEIDTDDGGCIKVDNTQQTSVPGIFAAGDCVCNSWQVVTAAGDGGKAGLAVLQYVRSSQREA